MSETLKRRIVSKQESKNAKFCDDATQGYDEITRIINDINNIKEILENPDLSAKDYLVNYANLEGLIQRMKIIYDMFYPTFITNKIFYLKECFEIYNTFIALKIDIDRIINYPLIINEQRILLEKRLINDISKHFDNELNKFFIRIQTITQSNIQKNIEEFKFEFNHIIDNYNKEIGNVYTNIQSMDNIVLNTEELNQKYDQSIEIRKQNLEIFLRNSNSKKQININIKSIDENFLKTKNEIDKIQENIEKLFLLYSSNNLGYDKNSIEEFKRDYMALNTELNMKLEYLNLIYADIPQKMAKSSKYVNTYRKYMTISSTIERYNLFLNTNNTKYNEIYDTIVYNYYLDKYSFFEGKLNKFIEKIEITRQTNNDVKFYAIFYEELDKIHKEMLHFNDYNINNSSIPQNIKQIRNNKKTEVNRLNLNIKTKHNQIIQKINSNSLKIQERNGLALAQFEKCMADLFTEISNIVKTLRLPLIKNKKILSKTNFKFNENKSFNGLVNRITKNTVRIVQQYKVELNNILRNQPNLNESIIALRGSVAQNPSQVVGRGDAQLELGGGVVLQNQTELVAGGAARRVPEVVFGRANEEAEEEDESSDKNKLSIGNTVEFSKYIQHRTEYGNYSNQNFKGALNIKSLKDKHTGKIMELKKFSNTEIAKVSNRASSHHVLVSNLKKI